MNDIEQKAWISFVLVVKNFWGNCKAKNYVDLVNSMLNSFRDHSCNILLKVHYLNSHSDNFPEIFSDSSEEQDEKFYQDVKTMEDRYQGRCYTHMLADF
ncbi:hypothetical protein AVEN_7830-1 [Araneus ventricosus]|uniref:Uncharacterized protein n=1 Tax=Araneus ventricosus TaxID=182803 RepID=A0A4Y2F371_ARAVE|nr:hypothetical protein AVEN_7830-1 [Araneus ventricosus]